MALPKRYGIERGWPMGPGQLPPATGIPSNALLSRIDNQPMISRIDGSVLLSRVA